MANPNELAVPTYLRQWRKFRKWNQEELAERAGLTAASISQLENGKQGFTADSLARLSKALGCTPAAILAYDPTRADSFWPLLEVADRLHGRDRERVRAIMQAALDQFLV